MHEIELQAVSVTRRGWEWKNIIKLKISELLKFCFICYLILKISIISLFLCYEKYFGMMEVLIKLNFKLTMTEGNGEVKLKEKYF